MKRRKHHPAVLTGSILMLVTAAFHAEQAVAAEAGHQAKPIIYETTGELVQITNESKTMQAAGKYTGLADPHTAEIEVDGEPVCFQLEEDIMQKVETWKSGEDVLLTYKIKTFPGMPDVKQFILNDIVQVN